MRSMREKPSKLYKHKSLWRRIQVINGDDTQNYELDESGRIKDKPRNKPQSNLMKMKVYLGNLFKKEEKKIEQVESFVKEDELSIEFDHLTSFNYDQLEENYFQLI